MSILRAAGLIAAISLISKVFGLFREQVIAAYYGTSYVTDAYGMAALLPASFALIMLAGLNGPFHSSIVTVISKYKARHEEQEIKTIIFTVIVLSGILMGLISYSCYYFAPDIINLIAKDQFPLKTKELAILQLRIMCPIFFLSALIGISYGILNVEKVYLTPSLSPIMASLSIILALVISTPENRPVALAWGTTIGAVMQLLLQMVPLIKRISMYFGFSFAPTHPGVNQVFAILLPASLSSTVGQVNIIITNYFASGLPEGSISALRYANFLVQLPLGVMLTALLVPMLPLLNESITYDDHQTSFKKNINKSMRSLTFLSVPATLILILAGKPVIQFIFQRGEFDLESTMMTYHVLICFCVSLIFYAYRDLLVRVFYALDNAKIPFYTSLGSIILIAFSCWIFIENFGFKAPGIALAVSAVTIFNMFLLAIVLKFKIGPWLEKETLHQFAKCLLASLPLVIFCLSFLYFSRNQYSISLFMILTMLLTLAGIIYIFILRQLKDEETILITNRFYHLAQRKLKR